MSQDITSFDEKLKLHEEKLDISKEWIKTADVKMHKETVTREETIKVPVERVELVIETIPLAENSSSKTETIRIPISEESFEIIKYHVILEEVSYYINEYQDNKCITETLKKEKLNVETSGFTTVVDKETKDLPDTSLE
ncbi:YsnF/AvaK domain-containing protein [Clostridium sp. YIM B02515]|uniref:YsnF/AvaK domain-containing protein n=1 Tax=Clostridium rhizosphaerae TaxID=2803861 RepID=A0ABS1T545_9CLOT|nr:YsnF/AvaK domain-containing protein [Clostridium rhizosphaerae]MBL4934457.1 YsnF/AvaK domain-containing protein [Clostridium rhizosphaerae]